MPSINVRLGAGPDTGKPDPAAGAAGVDGGLVVIPVTGGYYKAATDNAANVLGVSKYKAVAEGLSPATNSDGNFVTGIAPSRGAIITHGVVDVEFTVAAAYGVSVVAAAGGKVRPATATTENIIGYCVSPGGVLINTRGYVRLNLR